MLSVLTARGDDAKRWDAYVEALPYDLRDVHFTSAWGRAHETADAVPRLAVLEGEGRVVLQPFLLRRIGDTDLQDLTAAGYGGLVTSHALPGTEDGAEFEREMQAWRADNRVVSEFYLLNPIFAAHQMLLATGSGAQLRPVKDVVILHVGPQDEFVEGLRATRRHALQKAGGPARVGWRIQPSEFTELYDQAMERKAASPRWRLERGYFDRLAEMGKPIVAFASGPVITEPRGVDAAAIFAYGPAVAYYHLAATAELPNAGMSDIVIAAGYREARERGCDWLHLGGGVTADKDDSLLAYKRSFGGMTRVVYAVRRVCDLVAYAELTVRNGCSLERAKPDGFFPAYRAKEALAA
jgi:hypothetical protein